MIDIHAHILPDIDDGSADMKASLEMAAMAVESGVQVLAATPHSAVHSSRKNLWDADLKSRILQLRAELERAEIPLKIVPGMEIYGTEEVPELLKQGRLVGLNLSRYPLVEFAFYNYAAQATDILEEIIKNGMTPVVAHPERYDYVKNDPSLLNIWVKMGCLLQVNKGSLLGNFGRSEYYLSMELIERGFACAVASDAHSPEVRTTWMGDVKRLISEEFSEQTAVRLLYTNPLRILKNESLQMQEPYWFR